MSVTQTSQDLLRAPSERLALGQDQIFDLARCSVRTRVRCVRQIHQASSPTFPIPIAPQPHARPRISIPLGDLRHGEPLVQCYTCHLFPYVHDRSLLDLHRPSCDVVNTWKASTRTSLESINPN